MSKKEHAAVAVVVIVAMMVGLWAVRCGLDRAKENQNIIMEQAMSNVGELPVDAENAPPLENENKQDSEAVSGEVTPPNEESSEAIYTGTNDAVPEGNPLADALAAGDFSSAEVLIALGLLDADSRPSMGGGEMTLESLSEWMQTESMDALAAKAALQGAQAIAAGMGSTDDVQLRAFANSQGSANYQADCHRLEERALELGLNYLRLRDTLKVREEILAFYLQLEQSMQTLLAAEEEALEQARLESEAILSENERESLEDEADGGETAGEGEPADGEETAGEGEPAGGGETAGEEEPAGGGETAGEGETADGEETAGEGEPADGEEAAEEEESAEKEDPTEIVQRLFDMVRADLETLAQMIEQAQTNVEQSQSDLERAVQEIQLAAGNQVDGELLFVGELVAGSVPSTSVEEAVSRALNNRNELKEAAFAIIRAEEQLTALRYQYAPGSPEVLEQQAALSAQQARYLQLMDEIELEIRDRYDEITRLAEKLAVSLSEAPRIGGAEDSSEESASEGSDFGDVDDEKSEIVEASAGVYHLVLDENGQWRSNCAELITKWETYGYDRIGYIEDTVSLNLALVQFEHAAGVGTVFVTIA